MKFGELIYELRAEKEWTVQEINLKLKKKVSHTYFSKIESSQYIPGATMILQLADIFGESRLFFLNCAFDSKVELFKETLRRKQEAELKRYELKSPPPSNQVIINKDDNTLIVRIKNEYQR